MSINTNTISCRDIIKKLGVSARIRDYVAYCDELSRELGAIDLFELFRALVSGKDKDKLVEKLDFEEIGKYYDVIEDKYGKLINDHIFTLSDNEVNTGRDKTIIHVYDVNKMDFYSSEKIIDVHNLKMIKYDKVEYSLPSTWVKGYLRILLHKIVFTNTVYRIIQKYDKQEYDKRDVAITLKKLFTLYAEILVRDDRDYITTYNARKIPILVSLIMGSGRLGSLIRIQRIYEDREVRRPSYAIMVDKPVLGYLLYMLKSREYFRNIIGDSIKLKNSLKELLDGVDIVIAVLTYKANTLFDSNKYFFLPFTAHYSRWRQLPNIRIEIRQSIDQARSNIELFKNLINNYSDHLIKILRFKEGDRGD